GLMQPWRFIRISDRQLRGQIQHLVEEERVRTAEALGERSDEFMKLKVEGIHDCAEVLVAALMDDRERSPTSPVDGCHAMGAGRAGRGRR
ncbi:hypothetical protein, partial [Klebsiella pneumoniae]|uniref:hypothetical protein n=1 Tax=Klebsiella pneumoniae TaxID=573 RepID=UPI0027311E66